MPFLIEQRKQFLPLIFCDLSLPSLPSSTDNNLSKKNQYNNLVITNSCLLLIIVRLRFMLAFTVQNTS